MRNKKIKIVSVVLILLIAAGCWYFYSQRKEKQKEETREVRPVWGTIQKVVSTTGTVLPRNRLEVKPPVNGRIDSILVKEGDEVKVGQILAWLSSTERAALLDAARGQGDEALKYWQEVYKPIALLAPIDGEVIVATTQPGQTVTTADAVLVLSDKLIVRAQVDETDIGKIIVGQKATITLDAYPGSVINASVEHIYYESQTVNNVTIYQVDLVPDNVPDFFRSGMNATVNFIIEHKENVLLLPSDTITKENNENYVFVSMGADNKPEKRKVQLGTSEDKNVEVISGLSANDIVIVKGKKYSLPKSDSGTNPFLPSRRR